MSEKSGTSSRVPSLQKLARDVKINYNSTTRRPKSFCN